MKPWVMVLLAVVVPGAIHAQAPATAGKGLKVAELPTVFVVDDVGVETTGKLLRLDHEAIVVLVNGAERRFETRRVARVTKRGDSLKNGVLIGTVVGLVSGVLGSAIAECANDQGGFSGCGAGAKLGLVLLSTGVYAAIGTGIDAAIQGRTVLYQAPPRRPDSQSKGGASFAIRWTW
jgi:hypothetical protein